MSTPTSSHSPPPLTPSGEAIEAVLRLSGATSPGPREAGIGGVAPPRGLGLGLGRDDLYAALEVLRANPGSPGAGAVEDEVDPAASATPPSDDLSLSSLATPASSSSVPPAQASLFCWEGACSSSSFSGGGSNGSHAPSHQQQQQQQQHDPGYGSGSGEFSPVVRPPSSSSSSSVLHHLRARQSSSPNGSSSSSSCADALAASLESSLRLGPLVRNGERGRQTHPAPPAAPPSSSSSPLYSPPAFNMVNALLAENEEEEAEAGAEAGEDGHNG